jgi:hypothetical protein
VKKDCSLRGTWLDYNMNANGPGLKVENTENGAALWLIIGTAMLIVAADHM